MAKELTNRQLSEILGYALERAEKNINQSVDALEIERKRIETFKVNTDSAERIFKEADNNFKETLRAYSSDLRKLQETKPKWLQVKDYLLIVSLFLLVFISLGLAISFYLKQSKLEEENKNLNNIFERMDNFYKENPKEKEAFDKRLGVRSQGYEPQVPNANLQNDQ